MAKYQIRIRKTLDKSLQELFRLQAMRDCVTVQDFLSDLVEAHIIVAFRQSQLGTGKKARETAFRTSEDYRPLERKSSSPATVQRILFLLAQGIMPKQIAERLGVSEPTIYRIRSAHAEAEHTRIRGSRRPGTHGEPMVINPEKAAQREA